MPLRSTDGRSAFISEKRPDLHTHTHAHTRTVLRARNKKRKTQKVIQSMMKEERFSFAINAACTLHYKRRYPSPTNMKAEHTYTALHAARRPRAEEITAMHSVWQRRCGWCGGVTLLAIRACHHLRCTARSSPAVDNTLLDTQTHTHSKRKAGAFLSSEAKSSSAEKKEKKRTPPTTLRKPTNDKESLTPHIRRNSTTAKLGWQR
jgi:hypothetical protein